MNHALLPSIEDASAVVAPFAVCYGGGVDSAARGLPSMACPYALRSLPRAWWRRGWRDECRRMAARERMAVANFPRGNWEGAAWDTVRPVALSGVIGRPANDQPEDAA